MYDYLIIGSGLYGSTLAYKLNQSGKRVLVIDKRTNIAGNVYTEKVEGINFHKYGAHILYPSKISILPTAIWLSNQTKCRFSRHF